MRAYRHAYSMVDLKTLLGLQNDAVTDQDNAVCYEVYDSTAGGACTHPAFPTSSMTCKPADQLAVHCRRSAGRGTPVGRRAHQPCAAAHRRLHLAAGPVQPAARLPGAATLAAARQAGRCAADAVGHCRIWGQRRGRVAHRVAAAGHHAAFPAPHSSVRSLRRHWQRMPPSVISGRAPYVRREIFGLYNPVSCNASTYVCASY